MQHKTWRERFDERFVSPITGAIKLGSQFPKRTDEVKSFIEQVEREAEKRGREKSVELMQIHTEHDGGYCDTGEDMDWHCRSKCMELAVNRIREAARTEESSSKQQ